MTKILFVVPDFYPNSTGFSNASQGLCKAIAENGKDNYELYVYTTTLLGNNEEFPYVKRVFRVQYKKNSLENRFTVSYFAKKRYKVLKEIIESNDIDVIFFETTTFPFLQNYTVQDYGSKVFVRIHSTADTEVPVYDEGMFKLSRELVFDFMEKVPNIVSTSNYYLDFVKHNFLKDNVYKIWNNKTYGLLYNTVNIEQTESHPVIVNKFLTMGKMSENGLTQKGMLDLIRAVYYLKLENTLPEDFELTIIGTGTQYPTVKKFVEKLGLIDRIVLLERASHDEVLEKIRDSKSIVLLSRYEGQSMFITETIAMGKPIIISDKNGMQDMLSDGENGFSVRTGDVIDAASKLKRMMSLDEATLERFGNKSSEIYNQSFTGEKVYQQFDNLIKMKF